MFGELQKKHASNLLKILRNEMRRGHHSRATIVAQPLLKRIQFLSTIKDRKLCELCKNNKDIIVQETNEEKETSVLQQKCIRPIPKPRIRDSVHLPCDLLTRSLVEMLYRKEKVQFVQMLRQLMNLDIAHRKYIVDVWAHCNIKNLDATLAENNFEKTLTMHALQGLKLLQNRDSKQALEIFMKAEKMSILHNDYAARDFFIICQAAAGADGSILSSSSSSSLLEDEESSKTQKIVIRNPCLANTMLLHALESNEGHVLNLANRAYELDSTNSIARREILRIEKSQKRKVEVAARHVEDCIMIFSSLLRGRYYTSMERTKEIIVAWHEALKALHAYVICESLPQFWVEKFVSERKVVGICVSQRDVA